MVDRAALVGGERRERGERVGFGGGELRAAERAERVPAFSQKQFGGGAAVGARGDIGGQRDRGGAGRLPEQAAPLGEQAVDVAAAGKFLGIDHLASRFVGGDDGGDDLAGAEAVAGREPFVQVTLDGGAAVGAFAEGGEAAEAAGVGAGEAVGGEEIGAIEEERVERVAAVLEGGGEGETFGAEVAGDDGAAGGELEVAVEHAHALPLPERGGLDGEGEAGRAVRAGEAGEKRIAFAADEAGAAGIGAMVARERRLGRERGGGFGAEGDGRIGEETGGAGGGEGGGGRAGVKLAQEERPRERRGAFEAERGGAAEARGGAGDEDEAVLVEAAAAGAADHLE